MSRTSRENLPNTWGWTVSGCLTLVWQSTHVNGCWTLSFAVQGKSDKLLGLFGVPEGCRTSILPRGEEIQKNREERLVDVDSRAEKFKCGETRVLVEYPSENCFYSLWKIQCLKFHGDERVSCGFCGGRIVLFVCWPLDEIFLSLSSPFIETSYAFLLHLFMEVIKSWPEIPETCRRRLKCDFFPLPLLYMKSIHLRRDNLFYSSD